MDGARGEAAKRHIFAILDTKSDIDPMSESGEKPASCTGRIGEFIVFYIPELLRHAQACAAFN